MQNTLPSFPESRVLLFLFTCFQYNIFHFKSKILIKTRNTLRLREYLPVEGEHRSLNTKSFKTTITVGLLWTKKRY